MSLSSSSSGNSGGMNDPVGKMRSEIHEIEKQLQRAIEKRETLKLMISQIELEEHDLNFKLKNKKVEFRKLIQAKESSASNPVTAEEISNSASAGGHSRGVLTSISEYQPLTEALPLLQVAPLVDSVTAEIKSIVGPETEGAADLIEKFVAARSISTYPMTAGGTKRQGSPICDRYHIELTNGRLLFALSDGCNWGERPLDAAKRATRSFVAHISLNHHKITIVRDSGVMLLEAMAHAHNEIVAGKKDLWEAGTTTLIGGILFPLALTRERRSLSLTQSSPFIPSPPSTTVQNITASAPINNSNAFPSPSTTPQEKEKKASSDSESVTTTTAAAAAAASTANNSNSNNSNSNSEGSRPRKGSKHNSGKHSPLIEHAAATAAAAGDRNRSGSVANKREFGVALLSIGDCKCFHYDARTRKARDITAGNRGNLTDVTDPGGRIGPYGEGGLPDTRNLNLIFAKCHTDDLLIICTDGVHDNFDPSSLGIEPEEIAPEFKGMSWEQAGTHNFQLAESSKTIFAETRLEALIGEQLEQRLRAASADPTIPPPPPSPLDVATQIVEYAQRTTANGREFMEANTQKKLPKDYKQFPGKMDHTTCVVIKVNSVDTDEHPTTTTATVSTSSRSVVESTV